MWRTRRDTDGAAPCYRRPTGRGEIRRRAGRVIGRVARAGAASFVGFGRGIWLMPLDITFKTVGLRYGWLKALFIGTPAPLLRGIGRLRAERAAWRATRRVPAYRAFLESQAIDVERLFPLGILDRLPETDKANYVELLFDSRARKVGLRPRNKPTRASYKLRESPQGGELRYVSGMQFLESCGVRLRKARSFDAKWNDRQKLVEFSLK